jgi:hypothetical protein
MKNYIDSAYKVLSVCGEDWDTRRKNLDDKKPLQGALERSS